MKVSTNWLKDFVVLAPPLEDVAERLTLAGLEVKKIEPSADKKDMVFEIEITPNRADWLSHMGVAREIAIVENKAFKLPVTDKNASRVMPKGWNVSVKELEGCPYYTGVYIEGITHKPTPDFMRERLAACGVRSISLIVDITNYVLLETGQPLHAFDADMLTGQEIQVRKAKPDEVFTAIDGSIHKLQPQDLVIADKERPVALAGIMGGKDSEVNARTRNIFLESAFFHPRWIRQSARRNGLASDSSYRFERRVDPEGVDFARDRALELIQKYAEPRFVSAVIKAGKTPVSGDRRLRVSALEVTKRLGVNLKSHQISSILNRLGGTVKQDSAESWTVTPASFRPDLVETIDLVEEIARVHGYNDIPESVPSRPLGGAPVTPEQRLEDRARQFFAGAGFYETVTFSLISGAGLNPETALKRAVRVHNPLNKELVWMRPTLATSLLQVIQKNQSQGAERVPVFELANRYSVDASGKLPVEERVLAVAFTGQKTEKSWQDPARSGGFYDLKGWIDGFLAGQLQSAHIFESSSREIFTDGICEAVMIDGKEAGFLGEIAPSLAHHWDIESKVYYAEISIPQLAGKLKTIPVFQEFPRYPAIVRDLAVVVPESVKSGQIEAEIRTLGGELARKVELFDLFQGGRIPKGFKNLAYRVTYQSLEKTLLSDDIQKLHSGIADTIAKKFQGAFQ